MPSGKEIRERWLTKAGRKRLSTVADAVRVSDKWQSCLRGFDHVGEVPGGRDLRGVDLASERLPNTDLTETDLSDANLTNCSLVASQLTGAALQRADLSFADLTDANLSLADLSGADLTGAKLTGADLSRAKLTSADLSGADLAGCNLAGVDFSGSKLFESDLRAAQMQGARITGADLSAAQLSKANIAGGLLAGSDLSRADLSDCVLREADLAYAYLSGADLTRTDLASARLIGANLSDSRLCLSDLTGADLTQANLSGADLRTACLRDAVLPGANLSRVRLYATTCDGWDINGAECDYLLLENDGTSRAPVGRNFNPGEFEELFAARPAFDFPLPAASPSIHALLLWLACDEVCAMHPEFALQLGLVNLRVGQRATLTVSGRAQREPASAVFAEVYGRLYDGMRCSPSRLAERLRQVVAGAEDVTVPPEPEPATLSTGAEADGDEVHALKIKRLPDAGPETAETAAEPPKRRLKLKTNVAHAEGSPELVPDLASAKSRPEPTLTPNLAARPASGPGTGGSKRQLKIKQR